jgi:hypothetical protein
MKNLLLEILVTSAVTGFVIWRWTALLPRVMRAVQPVAAAVWERRREIEELQERGVEVR